MCRVDSLFPHKTLVSRDYVYAYISLQAPHYVLISAFHKLVSPLDIGNQEHSQNRTQSCFSPQESDPTLIFQPSLHLIGFGDNARARSQTSELDDPVFSSHEMNTRQRQG